MKSNLTNRNESKKLIARKEDVATTPIILKRKDFDTHSYFYFTEITKEKL